MWHLVHSFQFSNSLYNFCCSIALKYFIAFLVLKNESNQTKKIWILFAVNQHLYATDFFLDIYLNTFRPKFREVNKRVLQAIFEMFVLHIYLVTLQDKTVLFQRKNIFVPFQNDIKFKKKILVMRKHEFIRCREFKFCHRSLYCSLYLIYILLIQNY